MFKIEEVVKTPTWRTLLVDLIIKNKLDPWDVDIDVLVKEYIEKVRRLKNMDFDLPANVILACSILLKFKSLYLSVDEEEDDSFEFQEGFKANLEYIPRPPRKRPVTMDEIIEVMEKVMRKVDSVRKKEATKAVVVENIDFDYVVEEEDFGGVVENVLAKVKQSVDEYNTVTFSAIADDVVITLLALLFLANEGVVDLIQEEVFGEIVIKLNGGV